MQKIQREEVCLVVAPTNKCNRGCRHCSFRASQSKGDSFVKAMWIRKLVREAKELGYIVHGSITGVGEPLMHPKIVKIVEAFVGQKVCNGIEFTTSGFMAKDAEEKERFRKITNSHFWRLITYNFSFHLYSPTFSERLEQTLGMLLCQRRLSMSDINIICDRKNYFRTFKELLDVLACMEVILGVKMVPMKYDRRDLIYWKIIGNFLKKHYSEENLLKLLGDSLFMPFYYRVESKKYGKKYFRMKPYLTERLGCAESFPDECFAERPYQCSLVMGKSNEYLLFMNPKGEIFPTYKCMMGGPKIGTWETPLSELIARKRSLQTGMLRHLLMDESIRWGTFPCHECAALAKRNFSFE